jgi:hypothetical protein
MENAWGWYGDFSIAVWTVLGILEAPANPGGSACGPGGLEPPGGGLTGHRRLLCWLVPAGLAAWAPGVTAGPHVKVLGHVSGGAERG